MSGPVAIYLHGFASSPQSNKARAFAAWGAARGITFDALDLRVPSFEHLRLSAMLARVRRAIDASGGERARAVIVGSSLGGLTAARTAESDARVAGLLLMAPAFRLAERWRARLGDEAWERWRRDGSLEVEDHATGQEARLDFGFVEDLAQIDVAGDGWPDVRVPTCIVHGTRDDVVDVELSRRWAAGKPHVRLVEVDDGHDLAASVDRVLDEAGRFLAPFFGVRVAS